MQFVFYNTLYCIVCLVATVLCLRDQQSRHQIDTLVHPIIALAAFFGLFTFGMTSISLRYIFVNLTNVEILREKTMVLQLAVRVPNDTESSPDLHIVSYPLPEAGRASNSGISARQEGPSAARDRLATRRFAVVRTQMGENPWDLGVYANWKSVMGTNVLDWLMPIRDSPCVSHEDNTSFYKMGPLYKELRARYSLPSVAEEAVETVREMRQVDRGRRIEMSPDSWI